MHVAHHIAVTIVLVASIGTLRAEDEPEYSPSVGGVSAPIVYEGLMLVLTHEKGVAVVVFDEEITDGVKYRYRYLPKDGKEQSGTGEVFEKYKRVPSDRPNTTQVLDDGCQLRFKVGPCKVEWSYAGKGRGYVYYRPEYVRVQIANAREFEKLDLKRFMK